MRLACLLLGVGSPEHTVKTSPPLHPSILSGLSTACSMAALAPAVAAGRPPSLL